MSDLDDAIVGARAVDPWPSVEVRLAGGGVAVRRPRWAVDAEDFEQTVLLRWPDLTEAWADAAPATCEPIEPPLPDPYRGLPEIRQRQDSGPDVALMRLRAGPERPFGILAREAVLVGDALYVRGAGGGEGATPWRRLRLPELRVEVPSDVFVFGRRTRVWMPWEGPVRARLRRKILA